MATKKTITKNTKNTKNTNVSQIPWACDKWSYTSKFKKAFTEMMSKFRGDADKKALLDHTLNEMQEFLDNRTEHDIKQREAMIATEMKRRAGDNKDVTDAKEAETKDLQLDLFGG